MPVWEGFRARIKQVAQCAKNPGSTAVNTGCIAAYMTMHVTPSAAGLYMENNWLWTAGERSKISELLGMMINFRVDHDIDDPNNSQITVYTGRGLLH